MDSKKIIETLVKIAHNQQKIIHKLAEFQAAEPIPTNLKPGTTPVHQDPATAITQALGPFYNKALTGLSVDQTRHEVNVSFKPNAATQANFDHVLAVVQKLQNSNAIVGGPYKVKAA